MLKLAMMTIVGRKDDLEKGMQSREVTFDSSLFDHVMGGCDTPCTAGGKTRKRTTNVRQQMSKE